MFLRKNRPESVEYDDAIRNDSEFSFMTASPEFARTPQEILISEEGRRKIEEAIESLPVMYRSVIVLRDVEGFSLEEVSEIMDSSIAAIKSRLHRARNAVRESLMTYYMERDLSSERGN
jgi:RNA polymerase sigma-70 factor (ECF subfamily)